MLAQIQRDINIFYLVNAMDDIYAFVDEAQPLRQIQSHEDIMLLIAQQTLECGYFISSYCDDSFGKAYDLLPFCYKLINCLLFSSGTGA